jgi:hypothetical protein
MICLGSYSSLANEECLKLEWKNIYQVDDCQMICDEVKIRDDEMA